MATFQEIANKLEAKIKNVSSFKIGKTGQPIALNAGKDIQLMDI